MKDRIFPKVIEFLQENKLYKKKLDNMFVFHSKNNCRGKVFVSIKTDKKVKVKYVCEAIKNGAKAIITDTKIELLDTLRNIPILYIKEIGLNYNNFLNCIYDEPLKKIPIIGVTGTDGKTSQLHILAQCFSLTGEKLGIISSEGNGIYPKLDSTNYTTPRIDILYKYFNYFRKNHVDKILIECSSQGLEQDRLVNIKFDIGILTNINQDHIDYHKSIQNYVKAKMRLMNMSTRHIFINADCSRSMKNLKLITSKAKRHFYNSDIEIDLNKIKIPTTISNLYNLRVTFEILKIYKLSFKLIFKIFNKLKTINGRNHFIQTNNKGTYIIDYAHTPSSLLMLLKEISKYSSLKPGKIITIFGCGGDRDVWKRKEMGKISSNFSDYIILTDDNPRTENPKKILNDIKKGIENEKKVFVIPSRKKAIYKAISLARKDDFIVIAGKGNEKNIVYKNRNILHNDFKILNSGLK